MFSIMSGLSSTASRDCRPFNNHLNWLNPWYFGWNPSFRLLFQTCCSSTAPAFPRHPRPNPFASCTGRRTSCHPWEWNQSWWGCWAHGTLPTKEMKPPQHWQRRQYHWQRQCQVLASYSVVSWDSTAVLTTLKSPSNLNLIQRTGWPIRSVQTSCCHWFESSVTV